MNEVLNNKKVSNSLVVFLVIVSILMLVKIVGEIKSIKENYTSYTINIEGKGEVIALSDIAEFNMTLTKEGVTAKEAQTLLNESVDNVLKYLKEQKIADNDVKSEYGGINPKYSYEKDVCYTYPCPPRDPKIVGYTATQSINVKVREVDNANIIRTGLAELGVENINGPTFSIDDIDVLREQAKSLAIKDAKEKAEILAKELGVKLGKITSFSENNGRYYPVEEAKAMAYGLDSTMASVPQLPQGEEKITSNITIYYEIK